MSSSPRDCTFGLLFFSSFYFTLFSHMHISFFSHLSRNSISSLSFAFPSCLYNCSSSSRCPYYPLALALIMTTQSHLPSRPTLYSFFFLIPFGLNNVSHIFLVKVKSLLTLFHPSFNSMNCLLISVISAVYSALNSSITSSQSTSNVAGWELGPSRRSKISLSTDILTPSILASQVLSRPVMWLAGHLGL